MPDSSLLLLFAATALVLLVTPGPAVLFVVARTLDRGRAAGFASVGGLALGTVGHITAAALGVSTVLAASATAFAAVKYAGAAYLVHLGLRTLRDRHAPPSPSRFAAAEGARTPLRGVFGQAAVVNLLIPKAAIFFLAFLPQFVRPAAGSVVPQILVLGGLYLVLSLVTDGVYVLLASCVGRWARARLGEGARIRRTLRYLVGGTYLGLGVAAATAGPSAE